MFLGGVCHNQHHVTLLGTGSGQQGSHLLFGEELTEGGSGSLLHPTHPGKALGTDALHHLGELVDLLAGQRSGSALGIQAADGTTALNGRGEHAKAAALDCVSQVDDLHAKAGIRLIRAVALHGVGVCQARKRRGNIHI